MITTPPAAPVDPSATLVQLVHTALESSPYVEPGPLRIEAEHGAVQLHGQVGTYFEKQMAQEAVLRLDGVERLENHLEVNWV